MKNYYRVLGVPQTATNDELSDAYNMLSQRFDPNKSKGDKYIEERFIDITIAYKTLHDNEKRNDYDRILKSLAIDAYRNSALPVVTSVNNKPKINTGRWAVYFGGALLAIGTLSAMIMQGNNDKEVIGNPLNVSQNSVRSASIPIDSLHLSNLTTMDTADAGMPDAAVVAASAVPNNAAEPKILAANIKKTEKHHKPIELRNIDTVIIANDARYMVGNSKTEILNIQGTPSMITRFNDNSEVWHYGKSKLYFTNGQLRSYHNGDSNLLIKADQ